MKMNKIILEVDKIMKDDSEKNKNELNSGLVLPFSEEYQFCTNGIYFFNGKIGSGKTYGVIRHIMITDRLLDEPYYDHVVLSATSGSMDKTSKTFMKNIQAKINAVSDTELMTYLQKNVRQKAKYYAIMKLINSNLTDITDDMRQIINKHHLIKTDSGNFDLRRLSAYVMTKLSKYPFSKCPSNSVLILDDYGGHKLLNAPDSPLANFITKVRHYNYTVIIMCQTWRHICLNLKRLCTDFVIYQGYSIHDFETFIIQSGCTRDWKELWEEYKNLISPRSYMELHIVANSVKFVNIEWNKRTLL